MAGRIKTVLEMIKFEHSVFALPFALTGALLAARAAQHGWPTLRQILWIVIAMVAARSAAMTMNRIADLRYDRENPRTKQRALATGALSLQFAWLFTVEPPRPEACSTGNCNSVFLLIHEALHELVTSFSWVCAGHFTGGGVDRDYRWARSAHADSLRGGHVLGRGL